MDQLLTASIPLKLKERALLLEESHELEAAYASVASKGDTEAPVNLDDEVDFHYICFLKSELNGHLYQMDGDRKVPIDLGPMAPDEDVLTDTCLDVIRSMIKAENDNLNFSLMALVPS